MPGPNPGLVLPALPSGENHSTVADVYSNIAMVHDTMGNKDKALEADEMALSRYKLTLGNRHPKVAMIYNNLAGGLADIGMY